jgi:hypothetical protein
MIEQPAPIPKPLRCKHRAHGVDYRTLNWLR